GDDGRRAARQLHPRAAGHPGRSAAGDPGGLTRGEGGRRPGEPAPACGREMPSSCAPVRPGTNPPSATSCAQSSRWPPAAIHPTARQPRVPSLPDAPDLFAAALADRYRLARELGRGGMATVYLAHDLRHDRPVALKVLRPELAATLGPERFHQEIRIAARLRHPHILPVHDSGEAAGRLWYTMPYVEGESLRQLLAREGQLPADRAVRI